MRDTEGYELVMISIGQDKSIHEAGQLSGQDYELATQYIRRIAQLHSQTTAKLVEKNFQSLESTYRFIHATLAVGRFAKPSDPRAFVDPISAAVTNWLTAVRLFVDHSRTWLSREFGRTSDAVRKFDEACSKEYDDKDPAYRFIYKLRNYIQHCGFFPATISVSLVDDDEQSHQVLMTLDRDKLLAAYDGWGRQVTADLKAMDDKFEAMPVLRRSMTSLRSITHALLMITIEEAAKGAAWLSALRARFPTEHEGRMFGVARLKVEEDGGRMEIAHTMLPTDDALERLQKIVDGTASAGSLITPREASGTIIDAPPVKTLLGPENRGLHALTLWLAQGSYTDDFVNGIRSMLEEDENDVRPMVNGLIGVSAVLLHMTAILMGAAPETLLSDLYDMVDKSS